ncbi:MAG TPA: hypothetical protein VK994_04060, partial [Bacteroidales bacterium]|nr:hypothetical protein [Bacteroidales bacterium]
MKTITPQKTGVSGFLTFLFTSLLIILSVGVLAQLAPPPPSATITQARNGTPDNPDDPVNWT